MNLNKEFICYTPDDLKKIVEYIKPKVMPGVCIALKGELGSGKTEFVRQYLRSVGVVNSIVSPTFTYFEKYSSINIDYYHFDLYRLSSQEEFFLIGGEEILYDDNVCFIEWPEVIDDLLIKSNTIEISFIVKDSVRYVKVHS